MILLYITLNSMSFIFNHMSTVKKLNIFSTVDKSTTDNEFY